MSLASHLIGHVSGPFLQASPILEGSAGREEEEAGVLGLGVTSQDWFFSTWSSPAGEQEQFKREVKRPITYLISS